MLVVSANWAVADGTLVAASRGRQAEWLVEIRRAAVRAGWRRDGRYAPVERIDVVLAGDTLDLLTSTAWTGDVRPWHGGTRAAGVAATVAIAAAYRSRFGLGGLARWIHHGVPVPAADRRGRPLPGTPIRVPVRGVLLPGDRDAWLPAATDRLQRLGIRVLPAWSLDGVTVWHGAEIDPLWSSAGDAEPGRPTLGASLAVDLVARFGAALRSRAGLWPVCRSLVGRLASCRAVDMPLVVADWLSASPAPEVAQEWRAAVAAWRRQARRVQPACDAGFDAVDAVAAWMDGRGPEPDGLLAGDSFGAGTPLPLRGPPGGTIVLGHGRGFARTPGMVGLGPPPWRGGGGPPPTRDAVACVTPARHRGGGATVLFPDQSRPGLRWRLPGDDEADAAAVPPWAAPAAARVVEAA